MICPCCKKDTGERFGFGYEGRLLEINFLCSNCNYEWWIPEYKLKLLENY